LEAEATAKLKYFVLKSHNKLQITLIKNKILLQKREKHGILAKNTANTANTVLWQNHGI